MCVRIGLGLLRGAHVLPPEQVGQGGKHRPAIHCGDSSLDAGGPSQLISKAGQPFHSSAVTDGQRKRPVNKTILVVEDEPIIRATVILLIEEAGYDVLEASNADNAIVELERHPEIRVVFTDWGMAGKMNGLKLIHAVRKRWPPVVLILASGRESPLVGDMPSKTVFLTKPYRDRELFDVLESVDWETKVLA